MSNYQDKKIVMFDLDNTLTESKTPLDEEMKDLLDQLLQVKKVAIISGDTMKQIGIQIWTHLDCDILQNLYVLPANGSILHIYDTNKAEWQTEYESQLEESDKKKIIEAYNEAVAALNIPTPEKLYGPVMEDRGSQITFSAMGQDAPLEEKKYWDPDHAKRNMIVEKMKAKLENFSVAMGGTTSIDVSARNINKASGALRLIEYLNIQKNDVLYIGDAIFPGGNDFSMSENGFDYVKVSGPEETKKVIRDIIGK